MFLLRQQPKIIFAVLNIKSHKQHKMSIDLLVNKCKDNCIFIYRLHQFTVFAGNTLPTSKNKSGKPGKEIT